MSIVAVKTNTNKDDIGLGIDISSSGKLIATPSKDLS